MTRSGNRPPAAGISAAGRDRLHETMAGYVESGHVPGLITLLARGDDVHVDTIGTAAFTDTRPIARDTILVPGPVDHQTDRRRRRNDPRRGRDLAPDAPIDELAPEAREPPGAARDRCRARRHRAHHGPITLVDLLTYRLGFDR
jgi:hypothetical protein